MSTNNTTTAGEWSVYQRGDTGAWMTKYKHPATGLWKDKRIPTRAGVKTRRQAEAWAGEWFATLVDGPAQRGAMTLGEFLDDWLDRRSKNPDVKAATLANNRGHIRHHIKPALGAARLCEREPKPTVVRDFVIALRDKPTSPRSSKPNAKRIKPPRTLARNTVRNIYGTLQDALDGAVGEGLIGSNPCRVPFVRDELPDAETRAGANVIVHLSKPMAERLLACEAVPEERHIRYLAGVTSGARDGELAGATWADVCLDGEIPTINITKQLPLKGDNPKLKTKHALRLLPLHSLAVRALRKWKSGGWVLQVGRHAQPTDPVFPGADTKPYRPRSAELLREDLEAAGCPTTYAGHPIDFHATRRSFSTWLEANDVPGDLIDRMMGHAGKNVRRRHYSAADLQVMQRAIETIQLDLSSGKVIAMPARRAASSGGAPSETDLAEPASDGPPQTVALAAKFAARVQQKRAACQKNANDLASAPGASRTRDLRFRKPARGSTDRPGFLRFGEGFAATGAKRVFS